MSDERKLLELAEKSEARQQWIIQAAIGYFVVGPLAMLLIAFIVWLIP